MLTPQQRIANATRTYAANEAAHDITVRAIAHMPKMPQKQVAALYKTLAGDHQKPYGDIDPAIVAMAKRLAQKPLPYRKYEPPPPAKTARVLALRIAYKICRHANEPQNVAKVFAALRGSPTAIDTANTVIRKAYPYHAPVAGMRIAHMPQKPLTPEERVIIVLHPPKCNGDDPYEGKRRWRPHRKDGIVVTEADIE